MSRSKKESPLARMLKHHLRMCTYFIYSGDRHCSCGRDEAIEQAANLLQIKILADWLISKGVLA